MEDVVRDLLGYSKTRPRPWSRPSRDIGRLSRRPGADNRKPGATPKWPSRGRRLDSLNHRSVVLNPEFLLVSWEGRPFRIGRYDTPLAGQRSVKRGRHGTGNPDGGRRVELVGPRWVLRDVGASRSHVPLEGGRHDLEPDGRGAGPAVARPRAVSGAEFGTPGTPPNVGDGNHRPQGRARDRSVRRGG